MSYPNYFDAKKTNILYGLIDNFNFLKSLYIKNKLPNTLMLSGKKGIGKFTLINHLIFLIFDKNNYDEKKNELNPNSTFLNQLIKNIHPNIIYLSASDFKNIKIEDIRALKKKIFQTSISDKPRFVIFDDVELFNINSLNALLKIIEEPNKNNYYVLINNNSKNLIQTIRSRCIEVKVILSEKERLQITESLVKKFNIEPIIDLKNTKLSPGYFILFNYIYEQNKILPDENYLKNLTILLNLYKKNKEMMYIDVILFLTDCYFDTLKNNSSFTTEKMIDYKTFIFKNINKFFLYNLNQNALLNTINSKLNDE
jgi:DNA polymerase III subunit delta'